MPAARISRQGSFSVLSNGPFQVIRSGTGSAAVQAAAASLSGKGVDALLFLGSCGGIGDTEVGDIVAADKALDGESESFPAASTQHRLLSALSARNMPVRRGAVVSVASPLADKSPLTGRWEHSGVCAVDMECFYLFQSAAALNIPAAALLYVTDIPGRKPYNEHHIPEDRRQLIAARGLAVKAAVDFLYSHE